MKYNIHPIEPLRPFGPCEINDRVLIAKLEIRDDQPHLDVLSSSYADQLHDVFVDPGGAELTVWKEKLEMLSLAIVRVSR